MSIDKNLAPWQILGVAIRSEIDAAGFYTRLQGRLKNILLAQKYPDKPKDVPESSLMPPIGVSLPAEPTVPELFEAALKAEEMAEGYYNDAGKRAEDETGRRILAYLGRVERSHQAMIKSELELIRKFPDYYSVEDFHIGQDLFHVGP
jgi:rubrerythrin